MIVIIVVGLRLRCVVHNIVIAEVRKSKIYFLAYVAAEYYATRWYVIVGIINDAVHLCFILMQDQFDKVIIG